MMLVADLAKHEACECDDTCAYCEMERQDEIRAQRQQINKIIVKQSKEKSKWS
jgi:hypothetical protein